jgi:hypothetical protein
MIKAQRIPKTPQKKKTATMENISWLRLVLLWPYINIAANFDHRRVVHFNKEAMNAKASDGIPAITPDRKPLVNLSFNSLPPFIP